MTDLALTQIDFARPDVGGQDHIDRLERLLHQHLKVVNALRQVEGVRFEVVDLSSSEPSFLLQDVNLKNPVAGLGIINPTQVSVSLGWAGNRASAGLGISIPAGSYLVLPINTNVADVAVSAAALASDAQVTVTVFEFEKPPRLSGGSLGSSGGSGLTVVTSESPGSVSVGVASSLLLPANLSRKGLQAVNASSNAISLGLGHAAVLGNDIWLAAAGGAWDGTISGKLWLGAIYGIAAGASSDLALVEV